MTARGYKNIAIKFEQNRGLRHSRLQFKNRWEELKRFYTFWLWLKKQTGLGRSPHGGIVESDEFCKKHTKVHFLQFIFALLVLVYHVHNTNSCTLLWAGTCCMAEA